MRAVVQRVSSASVSVNQESIGQIQKGFLVLLGVERGDTDKDLHYIVEKVAGLRVFDDEEGRMNRSLVDTQGELLVVSQFTLLGDARHGKRPSFTQSAPPDEAKRLYERAVVLFREKSIKTETGQFQAHMEVSLINDGPVTILIDSRKTF